MRQHRNRKRKAPLRARGRLGRLSDRSGQEFLTYLIILVIAILAILAFAQGGFKTGFNNMLTSGENTMTDASDVLNGVTLTNAKNW